MFSSVDTAPPRIASTQMKMRPCRTGNRRHCAQEGWNHRGRLGRRSARGVPAGVRDPDVLPLPEVLVRRLERQLGRAAGAATNGAIPANAQTQAPVGSCNNVDNVLNTTDTTTTIDKSKTKTIDKSKTINSGNSVTGPLGLGGLPL